MDGKRGPAHTVTTKEWVGKKTPSDKSLFPVAVLQVFHHPEKMHKLSPFMMTSQVTLVLNI